MGWNGGDTIWFWAEEGLCAAGWHPQAARKTQTSETIRNDARTCMSRTLQTWTVPLGQADGFAGFRALRRVKPTTAGTTRTVTNATAQPVSNHWP